MSESYQVINNPLTKVEILLTTSPR